MYNIIFKNIKGVSTPGFCRVGMCIINRTLSKEQWIEHGRYTRPKTDPGQRLCTHCFEIENEEHFITNCQINAHERQTFFTKVSFKSPTFIQFSDHEKFIYLMSCKDRQILAWFGKFLYKSFYIRNTKAMGRVFPPNSDRSYDSNRYIQTCLFIHFSIIILHSTAIVYYVFVL